jgi:VanZ family protein
MLCTDPAPLPRYLARTAAGCTVAYTVVLVLATHYPKPQDLLEFSPVSHDKTLHFLAYGVQGLLAGTTLVLGGHRRLRPFLITLLGFAAFAAADEATQPLFGRYADPLDWVFDCIGLIGGLAIAMTMVGGLTRRQTRSEP